ncbi:hypothetical protein G4B88_017281 [Cannabis sativa]|uniref:RNase H type-1 domain-containing protein n=1 Tax=Cannabis sativa TaxID=3483 RepID=A0A7J6HTW6_CANSA|nr:hypothetical protein G4B88_017281 [Cannabis sativa]
MKVHHLDRTNSDRCPLLLMDSDPNLKTNNAIRWRTRFHFESAWAEDEECTKIVHSVWRKDKQISNAKELKNRLGNCGEALHQWNKTKKQEMTRQLREYTLIWPFTPNGQYIVKSGYRVTRDEFEDTIKVLWAIWENRNRQWNQLPSMKGYQLLNWVFNAYPKASTIDLTAGQQKVETYPNPKHWIPPDSGCICVNSDAAINENTTGVGLDFVWRTTSGKLLSAGMVYMPSLCSIKMAEAWALLEALKKPPAIDTSQIAVQTDCKLLVEEIKTQGNTLTAERNIIHKLNRM